MTEHGQIFKFDKTEFVSYELDLQNMVWFQNQDFIRMYFDEYMKIPQKWIHFWIVISAEGRCDFTEEVL